jgi:hypothetical protein
LRSNSADSLPKRARSQAIQSELARGAFDGENQRNHVCTMKHSANHLTALRRIPFILAGLVVVSVLCLMPLPVSATSMVVGTVAHVSTTDVEIKNSQTGQTMKFVIVPEFKNVFSKDGKTTYQMSALQPGTPVTVYYDKVLGVPQASKILVNGSTKAFKN